MKIKPEYGCGVLPVKESHLIFPILCGFVQQLLIGSLLHILNVLGSTHIKMKIHVLVLGRIYSQVEK